MSLSPNLDLQPQGISYQEREREREKGEGEGELQAVYSDTVEAAYCDHFGTDIN
jgi:hypothetical protein